MTSVAVSRLMLSTEDLAMTCRTTSNLLLSDAELSRVAWRKGQRRGELIVEADSIEVIPEDKSFVASDSASEESATSLLPPRIYVTVVGQYDDLGSAPTHM